MKYTKEKYNEVENRLNELSDREYKKFNDRLIPGIENTSYGVRVPELRKIAKEIAKEDFRGFISISCKSRIYEMKMITGMVIGIAKCSIEEKFIYMKNFVPKIDNWAVCDIFCGNLKFIKKNLECTYTFLKPYINSKKEFELRFALVILMDYFINDDYIDKIFLHIKNINNNSYYVKMAAAWVLSVCFIKYRGKTLSFLRSYRDDKFIYNKALQKMIESYRVSEEDKELLKSMKLKSM